MTSVPKMQRNDDCLTVAVAALFGLRTEDVPYCTPSTDWDGGYRKLCEWAHERGWYLFFSEIDPEPFDKYLARWGEVAYGWIASVSHPSWQKAGGEAHAITMRGNEIAYDPAEDVGVRPPLSELTIGGGFYFIPLDPARFKLT